MIDSIMMCDKCNLCKNQQPLLDKTRECQIFWVGLSAKKVMTDNEGPLSPTTNSGKLINNVETNCHGVSTYKTNLVKCVPLDENEKLRYPNKNEIDKCISHLENEIAELLPRIVFLLGDKVISAVGKYFLLDFDKWNEFEYTYKKSNGTFFVPIHHPSYVYVYKRKEIDAYINSLTDIVGNLL